MLPEETRRRQKRLVKIIFELAEKLLSEDEGQLKNVLNRLKLIYADDFKHTYSDFFPTVSEILKDDNEYNSDYLTNNMDALNTYLETNYSQDDKEYEKMYPQFTKLCDHLNLQIAQLTSFSATEKMAKDLGDQLISAKEELKKSYAKLEETNKKLEESNKRANTMQTELISILSIFSAIVIAFNGGITLLGSAVTSINGAKHYESVVMVVIVCGMVMFNTIFLMMFLIAKLTERDIFAKCQEKNCVECKTRCRGFGKIRKRLPYVYYFNFVCIIGIIADLVIWGLDISGYIGR